MNGDKLTILRLISSEPLQKMEICERNTEMFLPIFHDKRFLFFL